MNLSAEPEVLSLVHRYRQAARRAVTADVHDRRRIYLALLDLGEAARKEPDLLVRTWSERAVWEEAKGLLRVDDEEPEIPTEPFERAVRHLRVQGYSRCPRCWHDLPGELDFARWGRMRTAHAEEVLARERAVDRAIER